MPKEDTQFKPGRSGNPLGKPKTPPDLLKAKNLTRIELERLLNKFINMPRGDLAAYANKQDATAMELMMASIVSKAIIQGDTQRLDFLLNRLVGKVPDKVEATVTNPFHELSDQEKLDKAKQAVAFLENKVGRDK